MVAWSTCWAALGGWRTCSDCPCFFFFFFSFLVKYSVLAASHLRLHVVGRYQSPLPGQAVDFIRSRGIFTLVSMKEVYGGSCARGWWLMAVCDRPRLMLLSRIALRQTPGVLRVLSSALDAIKRMRRANIVVCPCVCYSCVCLFLPRVLGPPTSDSFLIPLFTQPGLAKTDGEQIWRVLNRTNDGDLTPLECAIAGDKPGPSLDCVGVARASNALADMTPLLAPPYCAQRWWRCC